MKLTDDDIQECKAAIGRAIYKFTGYAHDLFIEREDLEQEAWVAIFDRLDRYDPERGSLAAWAYWQARDIAGRAMKDLNTNKRKIYMHQYRCFFIDELVSTSCDPLEDAQYEESIQLLINELNLFSKQQRYAFYKKFISTMSRKDIGKKLKVGHKMVDHLANPVTKKVKELLHE